VHTFPSVSEARTFVPVKQVLLQPYAITFGESIREHTSAYDSIRQRTFGESEDISSGDKHGVTFAYLHSLER
jgi:hypothetical protein